MPDVSLSAKLDAVAQDASIGGASAPAAGNTGASTTNGFLRWLRDKFYQIAPSNWLAIGGFDAGGSGRALLTDATGKLTTIAPDCLDVSGSVSSADVLFTVDMLNYQSIMVFTTSAGTSCTIVYEQSSDNSTNWSPVAGLTPSGSTIIGGPTSRSVSSSVLVFPKRLRYFRARVSVYGSGTVSVGASATSNTVSTAAGAICWGVANEGSSASGSPVAIGAEARTSSKTSVSNGQVVRPIATVDGRLVVRPHSIPENEWSYAAASGGRSNTTTALIIKTAAGEGVRNYVTSIQVMSEELTNATELTIENGDGTVLWRTKITTAGLPVAQIRFDNPIGSTANQSLRVRTVTASGTGAVYVNAQGYVAP